MTKYDVSIEYDDETGYPCEALIVVAARSERDAERLARSLWEGERDELPTNVHAEAHA